MVFPLQQMKCAIIAIAESYKDIATCPKSRVLVEQKCKSRGDATPWTRERYKPGYFLFWLIKIQIKAFEVISYLISLEVQIPLHCSAQFSFRTNSKDHRLFPR